MFIQTITYSPISNIGLDLVFTNEDDQKHLIELPLGFDVNFLDINYTSVWVSTNSYLTFSGGSLEPGVVIPSEIPSKVGFPGVYISTKNASNFCLDSLMINLYTGTTDGGNTAIIRFEGNDDYQTNSINLVYNFLFYKDQTNYFDLIIEQNEYFCNDDSTGGLSDGINGTWLTTFDSSPLNAYRIYNTEPPTPESFSAGTEYTVCNICDNPTGTTVTIITPPHPVWTRPNGDEVTLLDAVQLGGMYGLNG